MEARGTVRGTAILLERPLPGLEGRQVRVSVDAIDEAEPSVDAAALAAAWAEWAARGADGPIEDEGEEWP